MFNLFVLSPCAMLRALALLSVALPVSASATALPHPTPSMAAWAQGARQCAYFSQRLGDTAMRIERGRRARILTAGQAAFMRQDLVRVKDGIAMILRRSVALRADEERSYRAMLDRVDARLLRADARRAIRLAS